jgi:hypothetical protein
VWLIVDLSWSFESSTIQYKDVKWNNIKLNESCQLEVLLKLVTHQQMHYLLNLPSLINSAFVGEWPDLDFRMHSATIKIIRGTALSVYKLLAIFLYPRLITLRQQSKSILFTHQQMHYLLNLGRFKMYPRIHTNIAPTCFGLRPSSGSLYFAWLKLC